MGYITQSLGGSWTVFVEGNLMRIAGKDADAIGKEPPMPIDLPEGASDEAVEALVWRQLRTCFDPEIPVNIVELGLVYSAEGVTQMQCMMGAAPEIAKWVDEHPKWVARRWHCQPAGQIAKI